MSQYSDRASGDAPPEPPAAGESPGELGQLALRSELVLRSVAEGIVGVDRAGLITFANQWAARAIGREVADLAGENAHRVAPHLRSDGALCDGNDCPLFSVFRTGTGTFGQEASFIGMDGEAFPVEYSCVPARGVDGVDWALFSFRNITERKRLQGELMQALVAAEKASRAKSQFLSNMSHELRTPLNAVIGYSEMLIDEARSAGLAQFESDLGKIRQSGRSLLALVDNLLDIARIEAGRMEVTVEDFEIRTLVYEVETHFGELFGARGAHFKVAGADSAGRIHGDVDKVRKILLNLLSNANKFSDNGEVVLEIRRVADRERGDRVEFCVSDNGVGIAPEALGQLFAPFTQGDASSTRRFSGTGLGLALSSKLAQLMRGSIRAASEPGRGSTFTVSIPAEQVPATARAPA
jgi:PAS domain S-box-containing protein